MVDQSRSRWRLKLEVAVRSRTTTQAARSASLITVLLQSSCLDTCQKLASKTVKINDHHELIALCS